MAYNAYNENKQSIVLFTNDYQVNDAKDEAFNLNILEHVEKFKQVELLRMTLSMILIFPFRE